MAKDCRILLPASIVASFAKTGVLHLNTLSNRLQASIMVAANNIEVVNIDAPLSEITSLTQWVLLPEAIKAKYPEDIYFKWETIRIESGQGE